MLLQSIQLEGCMLLQPITNPIELEVCIMLHPAEQEVSKWNYVAKMSLFLEV